MIVSNMSLQEIRKAVSHDVDNELKSRIQSLKIAYQSKWVRNGRKDFVETVQVTSKSKNSWRIILTCNNKGVTTMCYLVSYTNIGITASNIHTDIPGSSLMHFNTHFFKRYRERGKITIEKPEDLVKCFFRKNRVIVACYYPREDGTRQLFTPLAGGIGLGNYHHGADGVDICEFKTFVDDSLLGEDQKTMIVKIWEDTIKEITAELTRRIRKRDPNYKLETTETQPA